jgi:hypothetical protein
VLFLHHLDEQMDTQRATVSRRKKEKNSWTKTGLRVRDGEGDRRSGVSTACISLAAASMVARRPRGGDEQA